MRVNSGRLSMTSHLFNTRIRIEKFVYAKGTNVALYNVEHSKIYKSFKSSFQNALMAQIEFIADYKKQLPILLSLAKSVKGGPLANQVAVLLATVPISDQIDLAAYLVWAGTQGGQSALDKLGIQGIFGLQDQQLINYFAHHSNLIIDSVDDYTKEWIATKIQAGKDAGKTPYEIEQMLLEDGKGITAIRAERIVLTETAHAMKVIENEAAKRYGIKEMIWHTSLDERVCETCAPLEGENKKIGGTYPDRGNGRFDGPPAHVSCRCFEEEVIPQGWEIPEKIWLGQ